VSKALAQRVGLRACFMGVACAQGRRVCNINAIVLRQEGGIALAVGFKQCAFWRSSVAGAAHAMRHYLDLVARLKLWQHRCKQLAVRVIVLVKKMNHLCFFAAALRASKRRRLDSKRAGDSRYCMTLGVSQVLIDMV
jgi:hypothetical protein